MEKWLSKLKDNKIVAIILYARFPSEMAYGNHIIQIANSFVNNGCEVNIYYPKTYNKKTINEKPKNYYQVNQNINFFEVDNLDITSSKFYELMPLIFQKFFYTLNTFVWSKKLIKNFKGEQIAWSTNPNILRAIYKAFDKVVYEKHGQARYLQKVSINFLSKKDNFFPVALTKQSRIELEKSVNSPLYLPNGVDGSKFKFKRRESNEIITIGYLGYLETYGKDKGVLDSVKQIVEINKYKKTFTKIVGGPDSKINQIKEYINSNKQSEHFELSNEIKFNKVPSEISTFDIGIVPYPNNAHFNLYASPLKIFELASMGIPILASNIKSHLDLEEFNLGIQYFEAGNFEDFRKQLEKLLDNEELREELQTKSLKNIQDLYWDNRTKIILNSIRSSIG